MTLPYREFLEPHFLAHQGFKKNNMCNDIVLLLHSCGQTIEKKLKWKDLFWLMHQRFQKVQSIVAYHVGIYM